jgi:hypothetical protein
MTEHLVPLRKQWGAIQLGLSLPLRRPEASSIVLLTNIEGRARFGPRGP